MKRKVKKRGFAALSPRRRFRMARMGGLARSKKLTKAQRVLSAKRARRAQTIQNRKNKALAEAAAAV